jgi:hypothetical protein
MGEQPRMRKMLWDHLVADLCPLSWIQILENTMFRKLDCFPSSGEGRETITRFGPLERANLNYWTTRVLQKQYLEFRTIEEVHKPNNFECYTSLSDPSSSIRIIGTIRSDRVEMLFICHIKCPFWFLHIIQWAISAGISVHILILNSLWLRLALSNGPTELVSPFPQLETERAPVSETLRFLIIYNSGRWTEATTPVILSVMQHRQNRL